MAVYIMLTLLGIDGQHTSRATATHRLGEWCSHTRGIDGMGHVTSLSTAFFLVSGRLAAVACRFAFRALDSDHEAAPTGACARVESPGL